MDYSTRVLGGGIAAKLQERVTAPVLVIGKDRFTRVDLSSVACFNFLAAASLSRILHEETQVRDTKDLFDNVAPAALALPRLGAISLATLGAAFEAMGLGGSHPLEAWVMRHQPKGQKEDYTQFATMKRKIALDALAAKRKHGPKLRRRATVTTAEESTL